jgi:hypothetical protein
MIPILEHRLSASSIECVVSMMLRPGVADLHMRHAPLACRNAAAEGSICSLLCTIDANDNALT